MDAVTVLGITVDLRETPGEFADALQDAAAVFPATWGALLSARTRRQYAGVCARVGDAPQTRCERSAVAWHLRCRARSALARFADPHADTAARRDAAACLNDLADRYRRLWDSDGDGRSAAEDAGAHGASSRHRERLRHLPADWLEVLFAGAREPEHKWELAVVMLTGPRPCALEQGVVVRLADDGLVLERAGEKGMRGAWIRCVFDPKVGPFARWLSESLAGRRGRQRTVQVKARTLDALVARLGQRQLGRHITPMMIRAQVIADMKNDGVSRTQIAAVAGQMSTQTASRYGTRHQGRSGRRRLRAVTYEWPDTPDREPVADPDAAPEVASDPATEPAASDAPAAEPDRLSDDDPEADVPAPSLPTP